MVYVYVCVCECVWCAYVCVCACARARLCVCVCVCLCLRMYAQSDSACAPPTRTTNIKKKLNTNTKNRVAKIHRIALQSTELHYSISHPQHYFSNLSLQLKAPACGSLLPYIREKRLTIRVSTKKLPSPIFA